MTSHAEDQFNRLVTNQLLEARKEIRNSKDFTYTGLKTLHDKTFTDPYVHNDIMVSDLFAEYNVVREQGENYEFRYKVGRPGDGLKTSISIYSNMDKDDIVRVEQAIFTPKLIGF